ncbi:hypothetical protein NAEGRDRAFT_57275 [Naegleria gruberi]|uniref:CWH43-like N-terminal domain-containing protein n=1 Tax=Naegleria gruberi TaxID=5762 RepID=D2V6B7_NAEGR|nr:uncharacterized protein NAEGRDRAFT_57275 [Naegleria gruberi]EFC47420.1 hypothetical protein NAEGRDRAFT_57275 [Naegleria gruberi]|eukprot:XP_002680164.1 hypothetical protein NAEGRDRAFT_57275 [Naegleria gruberi strain NEG-M]
MNPSTAPKEAILSSIPAQYFPLTIVIGTISTIATTYTLSTSQGHTKPFPYTDITHTARFTPERYVFRVGMLAMAVVMAWNWNLLYTWLRNVQQQIDTLQKRVKLIKEHNEHSHSVLNTILMMNPPSNHLLNIIWYLGIGASVAITISSMCITSNSDMPWTMHVIAASSFFIFCLVAQGITTYKSYKLYQQLNHVREESSADESLAEISADAQSLTFMTKKSLYLKIGITGLSIAMLMVNILSSVAATSGQGASTTGFGNVQQQVSLSKLNLNSHIPTTSQQQTVIEDIHLKTTTSNIVEWTCTLLIVIYNITFAMDWSSCNLLTSIGQINTPQPKQTPVQQTRNFGVTPSHHAYNSSRYGQYGLVPNHDPATEMSDVTNSGRTVQQQAVYVFPSSVSSKQDQDCTPVVTSLYPATYNIQ